MGRLDGKVALVSGGARGQGLAEGALFASEGATVYLVDVLDEAGEQAAGEHGCEYRHLDVTSESEWEAVVEEIMTRHGRLDVVVNNAGILRNSRLVNQNLDEWNLVLAVNQTGVMLGMRAGARAMIKAGNGGSIINISSLAGLEGIFGSMAYGATKWAVRGMTKIAAKELGKSGIRVNSIHPGYIRTDMTADFPAFTDEGARAKTERSIPLARLGEPEDIARVALFLASDDSRYCTGQEYAVDGGLHG
jgi:3alpha(or 20beta)-hydroxysteroid dehydrogenase